MLVRYWLHLVAQFVGKGIPLANVTLPMYYQQECYVREGMRKP